MLLLRREKTVFCEHPPEKRVERGDGSGQDESQRKIQPPIKKATFGKRLTFQFCAP